MTFADERARIEILPRGRSEEEARELPEPVRLTVTCSPKHGPDRSVEVAGRLRAMGHAVTVHVAARMVRDRGYGPFMKFDHDFIGRDALEAIEPDRDGADSRVG